MIELLSPAGDAEKMKIAFLYGADAIYIGGQNYSLRANAKNFTLEEIKETVKYAHNLNKKVYVTVNIVFHDEDFQGLEDYLKYLDSVNVDAIIVSDIAVMNLWQKLSLKMELHVSTQASTLNKETALFYKELGATRVVLARECLKDNIKEIKDYTSLELEAFIHGAMCTSISGRCIMSNYATNRDANRGGCAQICRWNFTAESNDQIITNNFQICPKDLNMIPNIKEMIEVGVNSFKVEGRMRSIYYLATVMLSYKRIINHILNNTLTDKISNYYLNILNRCANRESTPQFFNKYPGYEEQYYTNTREEYSNQDFLGIVKENKDGIITLEQRNYFKTGTTVQFISPNKKTFNYEINEIFDEEMNIIKEANHAQMIVKIKANLNVEKDDIMRLKVFDICDDL
ncbi:MAG: U32 family peptidase [Tenericutes bacterium]|nr:U32 family peptidase [Mycoplasmatota bacterium]